VTFLDAAASDPFGVTAVRFFAREGHGKTFFVASAAQTKVGWLAGWDTTGLPDGTYLIEAVATSSGGLHSNSPSVQIQLHN
jgi:hypothetical protein